MIHRIHIRNYKSLLDVKVVLKPLSLLFGPNAAGKSNFIDALQLLSRVATSRTLKEAFEPPYRGKPMESFWFGDAGMEGLLEKDTASFSLEVDIELSPVVVDSVNKEIREMKRGQSSGGEANGEEKQTPYIRHKLLRYRVEIAVTPKSGLLQVADEHLVALGKDNEPKSKPLPFLERVQQRIHLRMEGQSHPTYFDRYLDHTIASRPHYPPHFPHLTALKRELESWFFYYFEPRERMRTPTSVKEVRHIGLMGEELASFLHTLRNVDPPQFRAIEKAIHQIIPSITGVRTEVNKLGEVELSVMERNISMPARVISEGTLRVLGLLALVGVKQPPALIGFEEPENGVHPRRIREIAKLLMNRVESGSTQLVVTTHSPILPDLLPGESLFVCYRRDNATCIEALSCWGELARRGAIDSAFEEAHSDRLPVSARMMRGDFDA
ncbi:MAG: AAA family ATPase [Bryobacterales bacterium]|nr:AAA family ATPase [Bryobacterales bacterium]